MKPASAPASDPRVTPASPEIPFVVSWKERICYGLSDTASNLIFQTIGVYMLYFYTDVFGLSAAAAGTMFLITRLIDAPSTFAMGILIDKTHTRWGQCRPYFLFLAAPFAVFAVLTFYVPSLGAAGKLIYAYITYNLVTLLFTAINLPISAMLPSMTNNPQERVEVSSTRMFLAFVGYTSVLYGTMPLVRYFGQGNEAKGFLHTLVLFAGLTFVFFLISFANTRERFTPAKDSEPTLSAAFRSVLGNFPWLLMLLMNVVLWIGIAMRNQTIVYYLRYVVHRADIIPSVMLTNLTALLGIVLAPLLTRRIGKRNTTIFGTAVLTMGMGLIYTAGTSTIWLIVVGSAVANLGKGFFVGVGLAMMADTVDYGEWKTGVRAAGFLFGASTVGMKLGLGFGGAISAWVLSAGGYMPNAEQTVTALTAIRINFLLIPTVCAVLQILILLCYRLDAQLPQVLRELRLRKESSPRA